MTDEPAIYFENVSFSYGRSSEGEAKDLGAENCLRPALRGVSFSLARGEFTAVMGSNGSGKSTLAMLACAALAPAEGTVCVTGCDTSLCSPFDVRRHIGLVMQNPDDQIVASIVENEVAFGAENLGFSAEECRKRVSWALDEVGLAGFEKREIGSLSGGQKQRLAIAGALAMKPDILILDEATSMLDEPSRAQITELARRVADAGTTVLMITHFVEDASTADRVLALKEGRLVINDTPAHAFADNKLQHELGWPTKPFAYNRKLDGRKLDGRNHAHSDHSKAAGDHSKAAGDTDAPPLVELREVSFSYDGKPQKSKGSPGTQSPLKTSDAHEKIPVEGSFVFQGVNLAIRRGELLAITGPTGCGKSTMVQLMNGLLEPTCGTVLIDGEALHGPHDVKRARKQVGLVFQYPEHQMFTASVYDEVAAGPRNMGLAHDEVDKRVRKAMDAVGLAFYAFAERNPFTLSGGEQRRVAIASVLSMRPPVLALDEPCAGLDPDMHLRFLKLLCQLHDVGQTIVLVSHELSDVRAIATRIFRL